MLGEFKILKVVRQWSLGDDRNDTNQANWPSGTVDEDAAPILYGSEVAIDVRQLVTGAEMVARSAGDSFQYDLVYVPQPNYLPTYQYSFEIDQINSDYYDPNDYDPNLPNGQVFYDVADVYESAEDPFLGVEPPSEFPISVYDPAVPWVDPSAREHLSIYDRSLRVVIRPFPFSTYNPDDYILLYGPYQVINQDGQSVMDLEIRDLAVTNLGAPSTEVDFSTGFTEISGDVTVYPNLARFGVDGWKPQNPIDYQIDLGHPALPRTQWITVTGTIPVGSIQDPDNEGVVASFSENIDLSPLVSAFAALSRSLPDILMAEAHVLVDVEDGANTISQISYSAVSKDDRQCRSGECDPPVVNTFGFPNVSFSPAASPGVGMRFTGCTFEELPASMGYGWQMSGYARVEEDADGCLTFHDGNGMIERWIDNGSGYIPAHRDNYITAVKNMDGTFTLTSRDQMVMQFDTLNRIQSVSDSNTTPNTTTYTYENGPTSAGRLTKIDDGHGRETNIAYASPTALQPSTLTTHDPGTGARVTTFSYDANDRLEIVTDPEGETTTFGYTSDGRLETIKDTRDNTALEFTYHPDGKVHTETSYGEVRNTYTYDEILKRMTVVTTDLTTNPAPDRESIYVYDGHRNIVEVHRKVDATTWNITHRSYNDPNNPHLMTFEMRPNGSTTRYTYTESGNVKTVTDALNNTTTITYAEESDPSFAFPDVVTSILRSSVTVEGALTTYDETLLEYNATTGNLEKITDALGHVTEMTYTNDGLVASIKNARGYTTEFEYGGSPRVLTKVKVPKGLVAADGFRELDFTYDGFDNIKTITDDLNHVVTSNFDDVDRLINITDARNEMSVFNIVNGRLQDVESPLPNVTGSTTKRKTSMVYDNPSRVTEVLQDLQAGGQESRVKYDYDGFSQLSALTRKRGASDVSFQFDYDKLGRMTNAKDPLHSTTSAQTDYAYQPFCIGNSVTSARGVRSVTNYDQLCRLIQLDVGDPDTAPGQELELATTRETRMFEYDELGRMVKSMMPSPNFDGAAVYGTATYNNSSDVYGESTSTLSQTNERTYLYDALDRLKKVTFEDNTTMEMEYDEVGNLIRLKDSEDKVTKYKYYRDNLLHEVQIERNGVDVGKFVYTYDAAGRPEKIEYPDPEDNMSLPIIAEFKSNTDDIGWTPNGELLHLRYLQGTTPIRELEYAYDGAGNRTKMIDKNSSGETHWEYSYDWFDRLKTVKKGTSAGTLLEVSVYSYDESDNMTELQLTQDMIKFIYTFDDASNLTTNEKKNLSDVLIETASYASDLDGNITSKTVGAVITNYDYDDFNKLVAISSGGTTLQKNNYSTNGFRRSKEDSSGNITDEYASGLATAVAKSTAETFTYIQGPGILGFEKQDGSLYYFLTDALGSVRDIVRGTDGVAVQSYSYDERGNQLAGSGTGSVSSPKNFIGGLSVNDDTGDSGLYLMGHRFYDSSAMRFMNRDPIGFAGGLNLFSYAGNNPVTMVDPEGLMGQTIAIPLATGSPLLPVLVGAGIIVVAGHLVSESGVIGEVGDVFLNAGLRAAANPPDPSWMFEAAGDGLLSFADENFPGYSGPGRPDREMDSRSAMMIDPCKDSKFTRNVIIQPNRLRNVLRFWNAGGKSSTLKSIMDHTRKHGSEFGLGKKDYIEYGERSVSILKGGNLRWRPVKHGTGGRGLGGRQRGTNVNTGEWVITTRTSPRAIVTSGRNQRY